MEIKNKNGRKTSNVFNKKSLSCNAKFTKYKYGHKTRKFACSRIFKFYKSRGMKQIQKTERRISRKILVPRKTKEGWSKIFDYIFIYKNKTEIKDTIKIKRIQFNGHIF